MIQNNVYRVRSLDLALVRLEPQIVPIQPEAVPPHYSLRGNRTCRGDDIIS